MFITAHYTLNITTLSQQWQSIIANAGRSLVDSEGTLTHFSGCRWRFHASSALLTYWTTITGRLLCFLLDAGCWIGSLTFRRFSDHGGNSLRKEMNSFNETSPETNLENYNYIFADETYKLLTFTIGSIGVLGFCNNIIVIILYFRFKRLRTPTNLLIVNISVSDLLVSLTGVNFTFVSCVKREWVFNSATCVWDGFSNSLFGQFCL